MRAQVLILFLFLFLFLRVLLSLPLHELLFRELHATLAPPGEDARRHAIAPSWLPVGSCCCGGSCQPGCHTVYCRAV